MRKSIIVCLTVLLLGSCAVFLPRPEFTTGMSEQKFLRQNRDAVISSLEAGLKTYRVDRGERFYVLATFENKKLVKLEERETVPAWMPSQPKQKEN